MQKVGAFRAGYRLAIYGEYIGTGKWKQHSTKYQPRDEADFAANHTRLADWLANPDVLALGVPSAVVSESYNYLQHPLNPLFSGIELIHQKPFPIDPRLWRDNLPGN